MSDYIKTEKVLDLLAGVVAEIIKMPPEELELVRCKDCNYQVKSSNEVDSWNICGYRPWLFVPIDDEHYCGYAERKTDG